MSHAIALSPTGSDDYPQIAKAVERLASIGNNATLLLDGVYKVSQPIVLPIYVSLIGSPWASIHYTGQATNDPLVSGDGQQVRLRNLRLTCYHNLPGVRLQRDWYTDVLDNVTVYQPLGCGVYLDHCYGSTARNVYVSHGRGNAVTLDECNGLMLDRLQVSQCVANDWPLFAVSVKTDLQIVRGLAFESCECGSNPAMSLASCQSLYQGIRFEQCLTDGELIEINGAGNWQGSGVTLDTIMANNKRPAQYLVGLHGTSHRVTLSNVLALHGSLSKAVVGTEGQHFETNIERVSASVPTELKLTT